MSLLADLGDYYTSQSAGTQGTDLFLGMMPPSPDLAACVYETGGQRPIYSMGNTAGQAVVEQAGIQVVVRCPQLGYEAARALAQKYWLLTDKFPARTINSVAYKWGSCRQSVFRMGTDEQGRPLLAFNADIVKEMSSTN